MKRSYRVFLENASGMGLKFKIVWIRPTLKSNSIGKSTDKFMPKREWDKLDNEDNKAMLELLITYLIGLVLMNFIG